MREGGLPTCRTQCPGTWVLLDGPFGRLFPAKGIVSTEFDEEEEDSPLLARLLVWKEPDETEPGLVIGAAVASSAKKSEIVVQYVYTLEMVKFYLHMA